MKNISMIKIMKQNKSRKCR